MGAILTAGTIAVLKAIAESLAASCIYGGVSKICDVIKANKPLDKQLRRAFEKAVCRYFQDELQQEKVIYHDTDYYIELLKKDLDGQPIDLDSEKYKKLYDYFYEEIMKNPALSDFAEIKKLNITQELIRENSEEIKGIVVNYGEKILSHEAKSFELITRLYNIAELPTFTLSNDSEGYGTSLELPEHVTMRKELTDHLCAQLENNKVLLLYGTKQIGKSIEAIIVAKRYNGAKIDCSVAPNFQFIKATLQAYRDVPIVVLDNLATEYVENTIQLIATDTSERRYIITTDEAFDISVINFNPPTIYQKEIELLNEDECAELIMSYHPSDEILTPIVALCSNRHPALVQRVCEYLRAKNWSSDMTELESLVKGAHLADLEHKIGKLLADIPDSERRRMLNRLLLFKLPFTEEEAIDLADVEPSISGARMHIHQLKANWLSKTYESRYMITPYLKSVWKPDLPKAECIACNKYLGKKIITQKTITEVDAIQAVMYYQSAEAYDTAGAIYVRILTCMPQRVPEKSILNLYWTDDKLPEGMSVDVRFIVRMTQVMQLKNAPKETQETVYKSLMKIVDDEIGTLSNAALSCMLLSGICFFKEDITNGLRYYRKWHELENGEMADEQVAPLAKELWEYMQSGIWYLLTKADDANKYEEWLHAYEEINHGQYPMLPMDYESCYRFVWLYIDEYHKDLSFEGKIELLDGMLAKAEEYQVTALASMILYKKMDMYRCLRRIGEVQKIYDENIAKYKDNPLAILVMNEALGYAYYQNGQQDDKGKALGYLTNALECADEDILPAVRVHVIEVISYIQLEEDKLQALQTIQKAYEYIRKPKHRIGNHYVYKVKGELAQAKWLAGDKVGAVRDMSSCVTYALKRIKKDSSIAKSYLCICDCALSNYVSEVSGFPLQDDSAKPMPGMFTEIGDESFVEEYNVDRLFITSYWMYLLSKDLKIEDLRVLWLYKMIDYVRSEEVSSKHGILQSVYPELLKMGDAENAICVCVAARKAMDLVRAEEPSIKDPTTVLYVLQLMPLLLYAVKKIVEKKDYSVYEQLGELLEGVDETQVQGVEIVKQLLAIPVNELGPKIYYEYEGCKDYPLYQIASAILLINEDTPILHAFISMCSIIQMFRGHCDNYYRKELGWVFDDLVIGYWERKIAANPEAFEGKERFQTVGLPKVLAEKDNKAKTYLKVLSFHIKNLEVPSYIEDWLM